MVGWHHWFNGHELEQTLGDERQGGLACCSPWGHKKSDMTEGLNETTVASRVDISWHQEFLFSFIKREKVFPSIILETTMLLLAFFLKSDKKIGVSGYPSTFLGYMYLKVAQLCPTLCYPMDCSPRGPSVHGIFQARLLEWIAISFSRESSWLRDQTQVSHIAGRLYCLSHLGSHLLGCIDRWRCPLGNLAWSGVSPQRGWDKRTRKGAGQDEDLQSCAQTSTGLPALLLALVESIINPPL